MGMNKEVSPIIITEECWRDTPLSYARYHGRVTFNGSTYWLVDKHGRDLFECTHIANKEGRDKAIEPGEPADLCRADFLHTYRLLGRDKLIELLKQGGSEKEIKKMAIKITKHEAATDKKAKSQPD